MITIDPRKIKDLENLLILLNRRGVLFANTSALNAMAFMTRSSWIANLRGNFTLRNKYTERSVRVERAKLHPVGVARSIVGSVADYMDEQEFGGQRNKMGKRGVPIPTKHASGEGEGAGQRERQVRKANYLTGINLTRRQGTGASRKQKNAIAVSMANKKGRQAVIYLDLGRRKGLFRVAGSKNRARPKSIRMLYDLTHPSVDIAAQPTLTPAIKLAVMQGPGIYVKMLEDQVKRLGVSKRLY